MREPIVPELEGDEFLSWEARHRDRHELHHGFVVAFAGGTLEHSTVAINVRIALRRAFPPPCIVGNSDVILEVSTATYYYPDATVLCDAEPSARVAQRPRVVVEVLSPSTRAYDLVEKRANYRTLPSLEAYLIVHTDRRRVEIDTRATPGWETAVHSAGRFGLGSTAIEVDEIYARTSIA